LLLHYDLSTVERGPLPPHERTWRHPSELAAEERAVERAQAAAPSTRFVALATGTLGLLAVGVMILTVTPRRLESPIAISATTTPVAAAIGAPAGTADAGPVRPAALTGRGSTTTELVTVPRALATPIGAGNLALVTGDALAGNERGLIEVVLPSGKVALGQVVGRVGDAWLVEPSSIETGHQVATRSPVATELVTVMASPPITVVYADVGTLDVHDGTAVLDQSGRLVGICDHDSSDGRVRVVEVNEALVDATTGDP
jgi:hypothetical protein